MTKMTSFFLPMIPPTVTHQEHKITVGRSGNIKIYDPPALKAARAKLLDSVIPHLPDGGPSIGPIMLITKWIWPSGDKHADGEYKLTRPDTDNMIKLLKDCMTLAGFWKDDAQVVSELTEKFYGTIPGIYIEIHYLESYKRG